MELEEATIEQIADNLTRRTTLIGVLVYCETEQTTKRVMGQQPVQVAMSANMDKRGAILFLTRVLEQLNGDIG